MARWQQRERCLGASSCSLLATGLLMLAISLLVPGLIQRQLDAGIREAVVWQPGSPPDVHARFHYSNASTPPPVHIRFWMFNITNLDEVRQGAKPKLAEVGPFTYIKARDKLQVEWDDLGRVAFKEYDYHTLEPNMTAADLDAPIATLNLPLLGVLHTLHSSMSPKAQSWADLLAGLIAGWKDPTVQGLYTIRTVKELLWGYEDKLLALIKQWAPDLVPSSRFELVHNMSSPQEALDRPATLVDTGVANISNTWNMLSDRGVQAVTSWACPEPVKGSDAFQFPPGVQPSARLSVWVGDMFRSGELVLQDHVELHGIRLLRFGPDAAKNSQPDPCHYQTIAGLGNITSPVAGGPTGKPGHPGPPVYVSAPHFCQADPRLAEGVEGLLCDPLQHVTYVDVEPTTGITMRAHKRLMISSQIGTVGTTLDPKANGSTITPIMRAEEYSQLLPWQAERFKVSVYKAQAAVALLRQVPGGLAAACLVAAVLLLAAAYVLAERGQAAAGGGGGDDAYGEGEGGEAAGRGTAGVGSADGELSQPLLYADVVVGQQDGRAGGPAVGLPVGVGSNGTVAPQQQLLAGPVDVGDVGLGGDNWQYGRLVLPGLTGSGLGLLTGPGGKKRAVQQGGGGGGGGSRQVSVV